MLFISGISWPTCSIPEFWKEVSWLFPSIFGINRSYGKHLKDLIGTVDEHWSKCKLVSRTNPASEAGLFGVGL